VYYAKLNQQQTYLDTNKEESSAVAVAVAAATSSASHQEIGSFLSAVMSSGNANTTTTNLYQVNFIISRKIEKNLSIFFISCFTNLDVDLFFVVVDLPV
jgi:hypothetical protein